MIVELSDLKTYLNITGTDYDAFLTGQISLFTSAVENYCGRKFDQASYTQTFYFSDYNDGNYDSKLYLFHFPLISVTEIKKITTNVYGVDEEEVVDSSYYRVHKGQAKITRICDGLEQDWFSGLDSNTRFEVAHTAGFAVKPADIQYAVFELIEERYNKEINGIATNFGNNVQRLSIPGTMSIDFDYTLQANERKSSFGMFLGNYINVFDHYRSERAIIGEIKENYVD